MVLLSVIAWRLLLQPVHAQRSDLSIIVHGDTVAIADTNIGYVSYPHLVIDMANTHDTIFLTETQLYTGNGTIFTRQT